MPMVLFERYYFVEIQFDVEVYQGRLTRREARKGNYLYTLNEDGTSRFLTTLLSRERKTVVTLRPITKE